MTRVRTARSADNALTPRLLTAQDAAAYFRLGVKAFERLAIGRVSLGAKVLYDRFALDAYLDDLAGLARPSPATPADNDPEAAFDRSRPALRNAPRHP